MVKLKNDADGYEIEVTDPNNTGKVTVKIPKPIGNEQIIFDPTKEKKFIGTINSDGSINTFRNDFATYPSEVFSFIQHLVVGGFILANGAGSFMNIPNAVMFIGKSREKATVIEESVNGDNFFINTYNQLTNAYQNNLFSDNSIMIIQTIV